MYAGMYTRRLYIQGGAVGKGGRGGGGGGGGEAAVGCASPLEGNKGGATREIKGAPSGRRAPRLRHVFLDNLFGNINHREHRETRWKGAGRRGKRRRLSRSLLFFASISARTRARIIEATEFRRWISRVTRYATQVVSRSRGSNPETRPNCSRARVENAISDSERMGFRWLAKITFLIERTLVTSD